MNTATPDVTLDTLRSRGLSLRQARDLEALVKPLSKEGKKPPRQDLSTFWRKAERAISGLGARIEARHMGDSHIHLVAPILLGEHIYEQFSSTTFDDWEEFQAAVEARYGLSRK